MAHRYAYLDAPTPIPFAARVALGTVAFHDDTLDRMLGRPGRIEDLSWADLMSIREGGAAVVPALTDLLDTWPECRFNVDLKDDSAVPENTKRLAQ